jgi:hypothetical protein
MLRQKVFNATYYLEHFILKKIILFNFEILTLQLWL